MRLPREFFARDTHAAAKDLLGKLLVRQWRGKLLAARIGEVESYVGENDRACHAARGLTPRTKVMFGEAGHAYVYLIYGMYHCLNIVTEREGFPAAVLVRGGVACPPTQVRGRSEEGGSRSYLTPTPSPTLGEGNLDGPGKLTRALHITRAQNGEDLVTSSRLFVADDGVRISPAGILTTPRIGVDYAGEDAKLPWRYFIRL
ncbi:MAG: DNA-3-methyladenine glycosylase [Candidatus Andersenbacteria bacterium]|nr:DNA-3-methyladenine glycosylase [Candidatus Andersenbacteria bacterium]